MHDVNNAGLYMTLTHPASRASTGSTVLGGNSPHVCFLKGDHVLYGGGGSQ